MLTTHLHLLSMSRMNGAIPLLPPILPSWRRKEKFLLFLLTNRRTDDITTVQKK
jgi:hypothetical protein